MSEKPIAEQAATGGAPTSDAPKPKWRGYRRKTLARDLLQAIQAELAKQDAEPREATESSPEVST